MEATVQHTLRAGTAIVDVSPPQGVALAGYPHHPRHNKGIHDPLYASCLYLEDGNVRLAIVGMDIIMCSKKHVAAIRAEVHTRTGVPPENVMICCSHSHSAPRASSNFTMDALERGQDPEPEYVDSLERRIVDLVARAAANPFPARLGIEKGFCGREQGVGGNRRDPMGVADPEVWTIGVQDLEGNWKAGLVKYALHPTFLHSDNFLVSADYPGYIRKHLEQTKPGMVFLFQQGTSGNQSPRYFRSGKTFAEAERVGREIGREADRVLDEMEFSSESALLVNSEQVQIDLRTLPDRKTAESRAAELKQAWEKMQATDASERDIWNAELRFLGAEDTLSMAILQEEGKLNVLKEDLPVEVQVIGIGDARIIGIQGEIFVEFGLTIQYRSPFSKCFVVELANGILPGYAATTRAYAEGGYETGASMLTGKSGEQLVDAAVRLLWETR
jgi:hypothetical protein